MFEDREQAGEKLALKLKKVITGGDFVIVVLLRGGIVLGKIISDYFKIPLLPLSVKKIGAPMNPELAIGAVTSNRTFYFDNNLIDHLKVNDKYLKKMSEIKSKEAQELQNKFSILPRLRGVDKISLKNKQVVIVDDGVATGTTAICAGIYAKNRKAKEVILATPVIGKDSVGSIKKYFDKVVALKTADNLTSVSQFYKNFPQVTDEEALIFLV